MTDVTATILLVEDDPLTRLSLKATLVHRYASASALQEAKRFEVVGEATNGQEAIGWLSSHPLPQVVLMDVGMPVMDGVEATRRIRQRWPLLRIVMLTSHEEPQTLLGAFQAGAQAYCLKETAPDLLCTIVQQTVAGACWVDPKLAHVLLGSITMQLNMGDALSQGANSTAGPSIQGLLKSKETQRDDIQLTLGLLTEREMDVLRLLALGKSNQDIADTLVVSLNTIKTHLKNVFSKLGVNDRTEAALLASRHGLG